MKIHCEQIQPNLLDYGKGLLSGPEAEEIKAHIGECAECAALLEEEIAFSVKLTAIPAPEPQNDVLALISDRTKPKVGAFAWLHQLIGTNVQKAAATAMALAILIAVLYNFVPQQQTEQISVNRPTAAVAVKWSDDPVGQHTDAMLASIDNM